MSRITNLTGGNNIDIHCSFCNKTQDQVRELAVEGYDIVVANILAEVLVSLTPQAARFLKQGGYYITSGILAGKEDLVARVCEKAGLTVTDIQAQGEWRCVIARR